MCIIYNICIYIPNKFSKGGVHLLGHPHGHGDGGHSARLRDSYHAGALHAGLVDQLRDLGSLAATRLPNYDYRIIFLYFFQ